MFLVHHNAHKVELTLIVFLTVWTYALCKKCSEEYETQPCPACIFGLRCCSFPSIENVRVRARSLFSVNFATYAFSLGLKLCHSKRNY